MAEAGVFSRRFYRDDAKRSNRRRAPFEVFSLRAAAEAARSIGVGRENRSFSFARFLIINIGTIRRAYVFSTFWVDDGGSFERQDSRRRDGGGLRSLFSVDGDGRRFRSKSRLSFVGSKARLERRRSDRDSVSRRRKRRGGERRRGSPNAARRARAWDPVPR